MQLRRKPLLGVIGVLGLGGIFAGALLTDASASSHREAPLITEDPVADNTDTYAFVSPDKPNTVTVIANWIPLEEPAGGPNFYRFGDDVLYDVNIDNNGDGVDDVVYEFRFTTTTKNPATYLYNTAPVTAVLDGHNNATDYTNLNVQQSYTVTEVRGSQRRQIGTNLLVAPANVGPRSTPNYGSLASAAVYSLKNGISVFAGPRDDPFFVDLGSIFDLGGLRPFNPVHLIPSKAEPGKDGLRGYNVHSIALQLPTASLLSNGDPVIGVYSTTYRRASRVFVDGNGANLQHSGDWVQISRLGMPLVNEVVIPLGQKDQFNASDPVNDLANFAGSILDPELGHLIPALYPGVFTCFPTAPRNDLVTIFATGIPGLNQPSNPNAIPNEMIRLNTQIPPTPLAQQNRLGLLSGQLDGFPNGRRLGDDVTDIELQAIAGATSLGSCDGVSPNNLLGDGVDANDAAWRTSFPYVPAPHQGYENQR